jgi:hypothetical protein
MNEQQIIEYLKKVAADRKIDPGIFEKLVFRESSFDTSKISEDNARGLGQILPSTFLQPGIGVEGFSPSYNKLEKAYNTDRANKEEKDRGPESFWESLSKEEKNNWINAIIPNMHNEKTNLDFSGNYLQALLKRYDGDYDLAVAAYNAGFGAVSKIGGVPNNQETIDYLNFILGYTKDFGTTEKPPYIKTDKGKDTIAGVFNFSQIENGFPPLPRPMEVAQLNTPSTQDPYDAALQALIAQRLEEGNSGAVVPALGGDINTSSISVVPAPMGIDANALSAIKAGQIQRQAIQNPGVVIKGYNKGNSMVQPDISTYLDILSRRGPTDRNLSDMNVGEILDNVEAMRNPPGGTADDTVPAMLTPGEAVIPAESAQIPANNAIISRMIEQGRSIQREDERRESGRKDYRLKNTMAATGPISQYEKLRQDEAVRLGYNPTRNFVDQMKKTLSSSIQNVPGPHVVEPLSSVGDRFNNLTGAVTENFNKFINFKPLLERREDAKVVARNKMLDSFITKQPPAVGPLPDSTYDEEITKRLSEKVITKRLSEKVITSPDGKVVTDGIHTVEMLDDYETNAYDSKGKVIITGPDGNKTDGTDIFKSINELFGFNKQDVMRAMLYYAGGRLSGGSHGGSMRFAGKQVLDDVKLRQTLQQRTDASRATAGASGMKDTYKNFKTLFDENKIGYKLSARTAIERAFLRQDLPAIIKLMNDTKNLTEFGKHASIGEKSIKVSEKGSARLYKAFPSKRSPGNYEVVTGNKNGEAVYKTVTLGGTEAQWSETSKDVLENANNAAVKYFDNLKKVVGTDEDFKSTQVILVNTFSDVSDAGSFAAPIAAFAAKRGLDQTDLVNSYINPIAIAAREGEIAKGTTLAGLLDFMVVRGGSIPQGKLLANVNQNDINNLIELAPTLKEVNELIGKADQLLNTEGYDFELDKNNKITSSIPDRIKESALYKKLVEDNSPSLVNINKFIDKNPYFSLIYLLSEKKKQQ